MITTAKVDAALDSCTDEDDEVISDVGTALADLVEDHGAWDWSDESEHDPSDRAAVVESSGAWWCVYRGTEPDQAWRFAGEGEALARLEAIQDAASGYVAVSGTEVRS